MASTPKQIHFVSRYDDRYNRGYTDLGDGLFSTEAWAVSADAAQSVKEVWLHDHPILLPVTAGMSWVESLSP